MIRRCAVLFDPIVPLRVRNILTGLSEQESASVELDAARQTADVDRSNNRVEFDPEINRLYERKR